MTTPEIIKFIDEFGINKSKLARNMGMSVHTLYHQLIPNGSKRKKTSLQPETKIKLIEFMNKMKSNINEL